MHHGKDKYANQELSSAIKGLQYIWVEKSFLAIIRRNKIFWVTFIEICVTFEHASVFVLKWFLKLS